MMHGLAARLEPRLVTFALVSTLSFGVVSKGAFFSPARTIFILGLMGAGVLVLFQGGAVRPRAIPSSALATVLLAGYVTARELSAGVNVSVVSLVVCATAAFGIGQSVDRLDGTVLDWGLALVGLVVAFTGWIGAVAHVPSLALNSDGAWRAASVLTYPNAAGALVCAVFLMTECLKAPDTWLRLIRFGLLVGLVATRSRGAVLALTVGVVIVTRASGRWRECADLALAVAITTAMTLPAMGSRVTPAKVALALMGVLVGAATIVVPKQSVRRVVTVLTVTAIATAIAFQPLVITEMWEGRLAALADRRSEWSAAIRIWSEHPVLGSGNDRADLEWSQGGARYRSRFVHNEYLQFGRSFGIVGLSLVLLCLGVLIRAISRNAITVPLSAGVAAAFLVHSSFDFLWHVPALLALVALILGRLAGEGAPRPEKRADGCDKVIVRNNVPAGLSPVQDERAVSRRGVRLPEVPD